MKNVFLVILMVFPTQIMAWGQPASATTTVEARITGWTENPCDYGTRFQEACDYARRHNLFPEVSFSQQVDTFHAMPDPSAPTTTTTVKDYGSFITTTTTTNYE
jgi:hypothetical protein